MSLKKAIIQQILQSPELEEVRKKVRKRLAKMNKQTKANRDARKALEREPPK